MRSLFLSDVHLGAFSTRTEEEVEADLLSLIEYCTSESVKMYLLGDLFDYWMEYPNYIPPLGRNLLDHFERYNSLCGPASFITGNHDYWDMGHFTERGFKVEYEYMQIELGSKKGLLLHGDGLSDPRFGFPRPRLNNLLRADWFVGLFQTIFPGATGNRLMKFFSDFTREENATDTARLSEWAETFLNESDFNFIVSGHDHVPRIEFFPSGTYINTGAFFKKRTALLYTEDGPQLVSTVDGTLRAFTG